MNIKNIKKNWYISILIFKRSALKVVTLQCSYLLLAHPTNNIKCIYVQPWQCSATSSCATPWRPRRGARWASPAPSCWPSSPSPSPPPALGSWRRFTPPCKQVNIIFLCLGHLPFIRMLIFNFLRCSSVQSSALDFMLLVKSLQEYEHFWLNVEIFKTFQGFEFLDISSSCLSTGYILKHLDFM